MGPVQLVLVDVFRKESKERMYRLALILVLVSPARLPIKLYDLQIKPANTVADVYPGFEHCCKVRRVPLVLFNAGRIASLYNHKHGTKLWTEHGVVARKHATNVSPCPACMM